MVSKASNIVLKLLQCPRWILLEHLLDRKVEHVVIRYRPNSCVALGVPERRQGTNVNSFELSGRIWMCLVIDVVVKYSNDRNDVLQRLRRAKSVQRS